MRLLLDENVPLLLVGALAGRGHDVVHVARIDPRAGDPDVMARARLERRILVSFDHDFGRMIFYEGRAAPPGVVYMRSRPDGAGETVAHFLAALDAGPPELEGKFLVIDQDGQVRVLPL